MPLAIVKIAFGAILLIVMATHAAPAHAGWLSGSAPKDLGVRPVEGQMRLKAPSPTRNSVSSQAVLYPAHPRRDYAMIAPLRLPEKFRGNGQAGLAHLLALLLKMDGMALVEQKPDYLRLEASTRWLGFTDDLEFWLAAEEGVIHVRSASRLGREDFGANRARVERVRALFEAPPS